MSWNLHSIVNPIIQTLHPNVSATLYRSTGQANVKGEIIATYGPGESIEVQAQTESAETLAHANLVNQEEVSRRFYLFSSQTNTDRVASIVRPIARNGDFIHIGDTGGWYANSWWLCNAIVEDFTRAGNVGWSCVRCTLQVIPPNIE